MGKHQKFRVPTQARIHANETSKLGDARAISVPHLLSLFSGLQALREVQPRPLRTSPSPCPSPSPARRRGGSVHPAAVLEVGDAGLELRDAGLGAADGLEAQLLEDEAVAAGEGAVLREGEELPLAARGGGEVGLVDGGRGAGLLDRVDVEDDDGGEGEVEG